MVSLNRSFMYGIGFASITWAIILYLYVQLTPNERAKPTIRIKKLKNFIQNANSNENSDKLKSYVNSFMKNTKKHVLNGSSYNEDSELGLVRTRADLQSRDEGYKIHAFNTLISDKLSLKRDIPDTRNDLCKQLRYEKTLPKASIIICFYNEHFKTLLRSVESILLRTPKELLHEIILVNDFSNLKSLHENLKRYFEDKAFVKLFKTQQREGLIRARLFGVQHATGDVLVFLDSHIEVNVQWLEPLLSRIQKDRKHVVMPIIDVINPDSFVYTASPLVRGGFNWGLHFKWENLPKGTLSKKENFVQPIKSPTMAGGLFAINRKYFMEMGQYDAGMNVWGGENLEISFRIWMCGGSLEMIPCSRVGHIFRSRRPYSSPDGQDTMLYNSLRLAHVWMDDYINYLELSKSAQKTNFGDISSRIQLRKDLACQDFDWYLKNIYPELTLPSDDARKLKQKWAAIEHDKFQPWHSRKRNYTDHFQIRLKNSTFCLQSAKDTKTKGSQLLIRTCLRTKHQMWYQTDRNELVLAQLLCLQSQKNSVILYKCHEMGGDQEWKHKGTNETPIYNLAAGTCLGVKEKQVESRAILQLCTEDQQNSLIKWDLIR